MGLLSHLQALAQSPERKFEKTYEVGYSEDLERVLALPRRTPPDEDTQREMAAYMTAKLRRDNLRCDCARLRPEVVARGQNPCLTAFRPLQGWYLFEASREGGAAGFLPIGSGKTALDIFLAMVVPGCGRAVLLIRPNEVEQFKSDFRCWSQHFTTPNLVGGDASTFVEGRPTLEVFPYSQLSRPENAYWFTARKPDVVIADEAQKLKDRKATSTGRFLRFFADMPGAKFFAHSGSLTTRGLSDFAHLLALALGEGSPMPLDPHVTEAWAEAADPAIHGEPANPGELMRFCAPSQDLRAGLNSRIVETSGVISTADLSIDAKLVLHQMPVQAPAEIVKAMSEIERKEERPDGETLMDQLQVASVVAQVACGFFYRWAYPRGEPEELIKLWFSRRQEWNREVRRKLKRRVEGMDSPYLLRLAAERHLAGYEGDLPTWESDTLEAWKEVEERVQPEQRVVWLDDYLVRACADWATKGEPGIVWYGFDAFGEKVAELTGLPWYGDQASGVRNLNPTQRMLKAQAGKAALGDWKGTPGDWIQIELAERSIIASLKAMGTGKNIQAHWRQVWPNPPSDGGAWEQGIGRCFRPGQSKAQVDVFVFRHTSHHAGALDTATEYARYMHGLTRGPQMLLIGERSWARKR
jgi:hypothetical protein